MDLEFLKITAIPLGQVELELKSKLAKYLVWLI